MSFDYDSGVKYSTIIPNSNSSEGFLSLVVASKKFFDYHCFFSDVTNFQTILRHPSTALGIIASIGNCSDRIRPNFYLNSH